MSIREFEVSTKDQTGLLQFFLTGDAKFSVSSTHGVECLPAPTHTSVQISKFQVLDQSLTIETTAPSSVFVRVGIKVGVNPAVGGGFKMRVRNPSGTKFSTSIKSAKTATTAESSQTFESGEYPEMEASIPL